MASVLVYLGQLMLPSLRLEGHTHGRSQILSDMNKDQDVRIL